MEIRQANREDYPQILQLQKENASSELNEDQKRQQGFIVSTMNEEQLHAINQDLGVWVVMDGQQLAGFVCLTSLHFSPRPPVVDALLTRLPESLFEGAALTSYSLFLYGPVCLAKAYRGKGLLRQLYVAVKQNMAGRFSVGVAFIDTENPHSLEAHKEGLGMSDVGLFSCRGHHYHLIAFKT